MALIFPFLGMIQLGIVGIGLSCLLSMFLSRCSIIYCINKYTDFDIREYIKTTAAPALILLFAIFSLNQFFFNMYSESVIKLVMNVIVTFVATGIVGMLSLFNKKERLQMARLFLSMLKWN